MSGNLYKKLLWEEGKRKAWAAALLGLILFFVLPVAAAIRLSSYQPGEYVTLAETIQRRVSMMERMLDFMDKGSYPLVTVIMCCGAVVMGVSSFAGLHNKKQVDFYHSLPVKRSLLFAVHVSIGILMPTLIHLILIVVTLAVAAANGVAPILILPAAMRGLSLDTLYYILFYGTVVLAMMMTGTRLAAVLGTAVFFLYFPSLGGLVQGYYEAFFESYYFGSWNIWTGIVTRITPVFPLITGSSDGVTVGNVAGSAAAILLLFAASFFLYQKRPLEAAGKTMAFDWSKGIIKILLSVVFGMAGAMFFFSIREKLGWMIFGILVGTGVSHCVIEVIYYGDFKKLFCHKRTMGACILFVLLFTLTFYFDLFGYDTYVPKEGQVSYASIKFDGDRWVAYGVESRDNGGRVVLRDGNLLEDGRIMNLEAVSSIAREGIRQNERRKTGGITEFEEYHFGSSVAICYTLKSGRKVYRYYRYMVLDPVMSQADQIYTDPEYKKALYPGLALDEKEAAGNIVYKEIGGNAQTLSGNEEQWQAVVTAYQEEMTALTMTERLWEGPIGELLLISDQTDQYFREKAEEKKQNRYEIGWYDGYFYPIYPSFTKTIKALEDCGIRAGDTRAPEKLAEIMVTAYRPIEGDKNERELISVAYTEQEEIKAILAVYCSNNSRYKNNMVVTDENYEIELFPKKRNITDGGFSGRFIKGKIPTFVEEDIEAKAKAESGR